MLPEGFESRGREEGSEAVGVSEGESGKAEDETYLDEAECVHGGVDETLE